MEINMTKLYNLSVKYVYAMALVTMAIGYTVP